MIQTHRDPRTAIASVCSLNGQACAGWSDVFRAEVVGRSQLELWAYGLQRFMADRAGRDPAQFMDVHYDDFVADPMGTVAAIYARLGSPLSDEARNAMATSPTRSWPEGRSAHRYALGDFGLTGEQVDERFAGYLAAYGR